METIDGAINSYRYKKSRAFWNMVHRFFIKLQSLTSDGKFQEILFGSAWTLAARIIATIFGLLAMLITARIYGAEVVGILAVLNSFFLFSSIFTVLGTNTSILRLIPEYNVKYSPSAGYNLYNKILYLIVISSVIVTIVLLLFSGCIADKIFSKPHLSYYFTIASLFALFYALMRFNMQTIRGLRLIKKYALILIMPSFSNLLFLITLTFFFFSKNNPIYAQLASFVFTGLLGWGIIVYVFRKRMEKGDKVVPVSLRSIMSISLPMLMTATMSFLNGQMSVLIIGILKNESMVGYYSIAVKLATLTGFVLQSINSMAAPKFSELFHLGKIDDLFHVAQKSARLIFWTSAPVLLGLFFFGKPVLYYAFGQEFVVAYPALLILIVGQFVGAIAGSCGNFMNMTGHQVAFRNLILITTLFNIFLNLLLIPSFGILGAATTTTICTVFLNVSLLFFIKDKFGRTTGFFPLLDNLSALWTRVRK